jgi:hypothetical protein
MHSHEEVTMLARKKIEQAETALAGYTGGTDFNRERLKELALAVVSARRELLNLELNSWPKTE